MAMPVGTICGAGRAPAARRGKRSRSNPVAPVGGATRQARSLRRLVAAIRSVPSSRQAYQRPACAPACAAIDPTAQGRLSILAAQTGRRSIHLRRIIISAAIACSLGRLRIRRTACRRPRRIAVPAAEAPARERRRRPPPPPGLATPTRTPARLPRVPNADAGHRRHRPPAATRPRHHGGRVPRRRRDTVRAILLWTPSKPGAQCLDLSIFNNGFAPGTFVGIGACSPDRMWGYVWDGLRAGHDALRARQHADAAGLEVEPDAGVLHARLRSGRSTEPAPAADMLALRDRSRRRDRRAAIDTAVAITDLRPARRSTSTATTSGCPAARSTCSR